jgi:VCBS repeat-containing protein
MNIFLTAMLTAIMATSALAADTIIGDPKSGSFQMVDNSGRRWNAGMGYTTNGSGDIFTLGGVLASSDEIIGENSSGNRQLVDNLGRRWPATVLYTTDGAGNVIPIAGGGGGGSTIGPDGFTFYGDPENGNDSTCDGSLAKKCKTITKLLTFCTDPSKSYALRLSEGTFQGEPTISWKPNVNVFGDGTNLNLSFDYTAAPGDQANFVFDGVGVNSFTLDLSLAAAALPIFQNGNYSITRVDNTAGAHFVTVRNASAAATDITGNASYSNVLFISSATIRTGGQILCTNCILGITVDVYGTGLLQLTASTFVGSVVGHAVGMDTPVLKIDAGSNLAGSSSGVTSVYSDDAQFMKNTPAGGVSSTTVQAAINELDTEKLSSVPTSQQIQVEMDGNDSTCAVGDLAKPCATIAGAESKILDASDVKAYVVHIGPGKFDVLGITKKSYVNWVGKGAAATVIWTSDSSPMDMTNPGMDTGIHTYALQDMKFLMPTTMNTFAIGGAGRLELTFKDMEFRSTFDALGRGGEDVIDHFGRNDYNDGFTITSFSMTGSAITTEGETKFQADNGNGAQMLIPGSQILGAMTVKSVDGTSFVIAAFIGGFIGGSGLTVDGAAAEAYLDDSSVISGSVTLLNSGTTELVSDSKFEKYTPATSGLWNVVPSTVKAALDSIAAGDLRPSSWTVAGPSISTVSLTDSGGIGATGSASSHTTVDGSNTTIGVQGVANATVDAGMTNDKAVIGVFSTATRGDGTDDGTLHEMDGAYGLMFHNAGAAGVTQKVIGIGSTLLNFGGTITDLYDVKPEAVPAGGNVTNHYGLYIERSPFGLEKKSWIADKTKIGGTSYSIPTESLEVEGNLKVSGNAILSTAGSGIQIKEGADAKMGACTFVAGACTVSTAAVHTTSHVFISCNGTSTGHGSLWVENIIEATSFEIHSTNALDDCTPVAWMIMDPAA